MFGLVSGRIGYIQVVAVLRATLPLPVGNLLVSPAGLFMPDNQAQRSHHPDGGRKAYPKSHAQPFRLGFFNFNGAE
jgi:hypothetical protein